MTGAQARPDKPAAPSSPSPAGLNPYPSTYRAPQSPPVLIRSATVLTGTGTRLDAADVLIVDGRISAIGPGLAAPAGAKVIEAQGRWVTPGPDRRSLAPRRLSEPGRARRTTTATSRRTR